LKEVFAPVDARSAEAIFSDGDTTDVLKRLVLLGTYVAEDPQKPSFLGSESVFQAQNEE
jgi:hypothetical protein